jgi:hypothetical protein
MPDARTIPLLLLLLAMASACGDDPATSPSLVSIETVTLTADGEGGSARPEIVATSNRVFVAYLGNIGTGSGRRFDAKIYDASFDTLITTTTLVETTTEYGGPTDIRVASDGDYLYAFYETNKPTSPTTAETYLWARKYLLNDGLDLVASTATPIASSNSMGELGDGGELLDDPAPLVGPDSVFVITRLKYSLATTGSTIYRVRELTKDLVQLREFDLDLSSAADGRGRVTSLLFSNDRIYIALASTVSDEVIIEDTDDGALCDLVLVAMRPDWTFEPQDVHTISAEPDDRENYVAGLKSDGTFLYVTYKQAVGSPPDGEQRAVIKMFDGDLAEVHEEVVRTALWGPGGGEMRPSLEVFGDRIFSGQSAGESLGAGNALIHVYRVE